MSNVDQSLEMQLHMEKAQREAGRVSSPLLRAIAEYLEGKTISGEIKLNVLCVKADSVLFDLRGVEGFDHVEFEIRQTGFGRAINATRTEGE